MMGGGEERERERERQWRRQKKKNEKKYKYKMFRVFKEWIKTFQEFFFV